MKQLSRLIFSAIGMALGVAVLVMLIIMEEPNTKVILMLVSLGMASQGVAIFDLITESTERNKNNE